MLEAGDEPVEAIANAIGYEDAGFFGRLFKGKVNLTPVQYRRRFGAMWGSLAATSRRRLRILPSIGQGAQSVLPTTFCLRRKFVFVEAVSPSDN